jgi:hypothetical protein
VNYYQGNENQITSNVKLIHRYLIMMFKSEYNGKECSEKFEVMDQTPIITRTKSIRTTGKTYFGKHYGNTLCEELYSFDRSYLMPSPKVLGLEREEPKILLAYLKWLGVSDLPKLIQKQLNRADPDWSYCEYVLKNYNYKNPIQKFKFDDYEDLRKTLNSSYNSLNSIIVSQFEGLDEMLRSSKPITIFKWIKGDERIRKILEEDRESEYYAGVFFWFKHQQSLSKIPPNEMKSFIRWEFSKIDWFPVLSSRKTAPPDDCCLAKTISEEFSPFVEKPDIELDYLSENLKLSTEVLENYLILVGIHREINSFDNDHLYSLLKSLPDSDPKGVVAQSIYREIINNYDEKKIDIHSLIYQDFNADGRVLCDIGNRKGYQKAKDAYYIDSKFYGDNVTKNFPIICLDKKRGKQKVLRIFGVKALENLNITLKDSPIIHNLLKLMRTP